nr:2-aminobenzoate-CoA ligase [Pseudomonas sp.]CAA47168.1 2-aminobenzoate-CoA ligase [Pseudomonas sp.]
MCQVLCTSHVDTFARDRLPPSEQQQLSSLISISELGLVQTVRAVFAARTVAAATAERQEPDYYPEHALHTKASASPQNEPDRKHSPHARCRLTIVPGSPGKSLDPARYLKAANTALKKTKRDSKRHQQHGSKRKRPMHRTTKNEPNPPTLHKLRKINKTPHRSQSSLHVLLTNTHKQELINVLMLSSLIKDVSAAQAPGYGYAAVASKPAATTGPTAVGKAVDRLLSYVIAAVSRRTPLSTMPTQHSRRRHTPRGPATPMQAITHSYLMLCFLPQRLRMCIAAVEDVLLSGLLPLQREREGRRRRRNGPPRPRPVRRVSSLPMREPTRVSRRWGGRRSPGSRVDWSRRAPIRRATAPRAQTETPSSGPVDEPTAEEKEIEEKLCETDPSARGQVHLGGKRHVRYGRRPMRKRCGRTARARQDRGDSRRSGGHVGRCLRGAGGRVPVLASFSVAREANDVGAEARMDGLASHGGDAHGGDPRRVHLVQGLIWKRYRRCSTGSMRSMNGSPMASTPSWSSFMRGSRSRRLTWWYEALVWKLTLAWDIGPGRSAVVSELSMASTIQTWLSVLPSNARSLVNYARVPEAINLIATAGFSKIVLRFIA